LEIASVIGFNNKQTLYVCVGVYKNNTSRVNVGVVGNESRHTAESRDQVLFESLETSLVAKQVEQLFSQNLKYSSERTKQQTTT